jgi:type III restriction enzyme
MIKLPIVLTEHQTWQEALRDSILTRQKLQELAAREKDFVRPIVLIQAESKDREVTVEVVKNHLVEQEKIPRERIAIATGAQRELDGINLLDPENKTEFVITVEALKEGWDCPFAYVFCSVANVHSKKDVEQLLGRVLRMPYARRRKQEDLNRAYAHVSSASWPQAVNQLCDRLVDMGFEEQEAEQFVQPQLTLPPLDGSGALRTDEPLQLTLREKPDLSYLTIEEQASISVVPTQGGQVVLQVRGKISDEFESRLLDALPEHDRAAAQRTIAVHRRHHRLSPSERGETFVVPQLCLWIDGELELADEESFIGPTGWNLLDYPAQLSEFEFSIREESESFEIDIQGKRLVTRYLGAQAALDLNDAQTTWTNLQLSRKLDPRLRDKNIKQEVLLEFIRQTIDYLTERRKIPLAALWRAQYPLQKALAAKIQDYKEQAYQNGYQRNLLDPGAPVETSYEYSYTFPKDYAPNSIYRGRFQFEHHFYPLVGAFDSDEEFDCAEVIDRSKRINTWIRNLSQSDAAFRLPLASGNFYPDFVVNLAHERILIVEYKGAHLVNDPKEKQKRNIGEKWEEASHGKAMFLWAVKRDEQGRDLYHQFEDKIAQTA